jgi:hypothetical protein
VHVKEVICRAAFSQRTAKKMHVKKIFFCVVFPWCMANIFFPPPDGTSFDNRQLFVPFVVRQNLPCVSRRVFSYGARQNIF